MEYFEGRLDDLLEQASQGAIASTDFLTPQERASARRYLTRSGAGFEFAGGYGSAERSMLMVFPEWLSAMDEDSRRGVLQEEQSERVVPLMLAREAYLVAHPEDIRRPVGHRDYLGALIGLGIDRGRIGDICVTDTGAAVFFTRQTAEFLLSAERPLTQVGREKIEVMPFDVPEGFDGWRRYETISGVGASARIDSALAALTGLSREKIKDAILRGEAEKNYETAEKPDDGVEPGDILSLRGWGKCRLTDISSTRKDRLRFSADKYV